MLSKESNMETSERAERKTQLKKNLKKEKREQVLKNLDSLENLIKVNPSISNSEELLFCVAETKTKAKAQSEALRLAEVVCFCGHKEKDDIYYKHLLYDALKKIYEQE